MGQLIKSHAPDIERRWLEWVSADLVATPDVQPIWLRQRTADYLAALAALVSESGPDLEALGAAAWAHVAREHGITSAREGLDIGQLIRELGTLRHVIRAIMTEQDLVIDGVEDALADLIDTAIAQSVRAYVDARDQAARRLHAEHLGSLTHELRNPLAAAVQAAMLVRAQCTIGQGHALDLLDRNHRRLTELIDSVLETERLEAGTVAPRLAEVRLGELVDAATAVARETADRKGIAFDVRYQPDRCVRLDVDLCRSALQNLVDNAVKYTDVGGVEVLVDDRETTWSVHVRDTGPGLSSEDLRTIFEPFRRGLTSKQGTGLGLAIARRAIEAQGGSIHAESVAETGSHFWFTLPKPGASGAALARPRRP